MRSVTRRASLMYRRQKEEDAPTTIETPTHANLYIYMYTELNTMCLRAELRQTDEETLRTHSETMQTARWSLCWKHTGLPRAEAASRACGKTTKREKEEQTLAEPSRHGCGAKLRRETLNKNITKP